MRVLIRYNRASSYKKYKIKSLPGGRMAELTLKMLVEFPGNQSVIIEHGYENLPRGDAGKTD